MGSGVSSPVSSSPDILASYDEEQVEMLGKCVQQGVSAVHISTSTMYYKFEDVSFPFQDPALFNTDKFLSSYPEKIKSYTITSNFDNALNFKFKLGDRQKSYCVLIFKNGVQIKGSKSASSDYEVIKGILAAYDISIPVNIAELYPIMINAYFDTHKFLCLDTLAAFLTTKNLEIVLKPTKLKLSLTHTVDDVTKKITGILYPSGKVNLMGANRFAQVVAFFFFVVSALKDAPEAIKGDFVAKPIRPKGKPGRKRKLDKTLENEKLKLLCM